MKILYLCHVDWRWIKQRPQFLAEKLSENNDIDIYYQPSYRKNNLQNKLKNDEICIKPLSKIPLKNRFKLLFYLNNFFQKKFIKKIFEKNDFDVIYFTHPEFYPLIKKLTGIKVYDCMDDHSEFFEVKDHRKKLIENIQNEIIFDSQIKIIATSLHLAKKLTSVNPKLNIKLVRNGLKSELVESLENKSKPERSDKNNFVITYFGTVASWFDFDILREVVNSYDKVEFHIYGPLEVELSKFTERIFYKGIAEHGNLKNIAKNADALIMPFIVNELIESVDPVKLYEYLAFRKPIISCKYLEIERFQGLVSFYENKNEILEAIYKLITSELDIPEYSIVYQFLLDSTWDSRAKDLNGFLESCMSDIKRG